MEVYLQTFEIYKDILSINPIEFAESMNNAEKPKEIHEIQAEIKKVQLKTLEISVLFLTSAKTAGVDSDLLLLGLVQGLVVDATGQVQTDQQKPKGRDRAQSGQVERLSVHASASDIA